MAELGMVANKGQKIVHQGVGTIGTIVGTAYGGYLVEVDGHEKFLPFDKIDQWEMI